MAALLHEPGAAVFAAELARAWPMFLILAGLVTLFVLAGRRF